MKRIVTLLTAGLWLLCTTVTAQKKDVLLQKTESLLQQDKRIAAYEINAQRGSVQAIRFDQWNPYPASEINRLFTTYFNNQEGIDAYKVISQKTVYDNIRVVRYQQYFKGIKVEFGTVVAISKNELLRSIMAESYVTEANKPTVPALTESSALSKAMAYTGASIYAWQDHTVKKEEGGAYPKGELVLMPDMRQGKSEMVLAWKFDNYTTEPLSRNYVYISAADGSLVFKDAILKHSNATGTAATRYSGTKTITTDYTGTNYRLRETSSFMNGIETYRADNSDVADNDNNWTAAEFNNAQKDDAALDAHWGAEQVVAYWRNIHNRRSYDNAGAKIKSLVHVGTNYDNAYWDGSTMNYGDGSATGPTSGGFYPFTSLDICAHEIGHAVCQYTSHLVYSGESGAMNEGFSDIWGACLENYADPSNSRYEPFLIGEQLTPSWIKGTNRTAFRDMANPPAQRDPDTYLGMYWYTGSDDDSYVHINSGVLNKWFYLITHGEAGTNDLGNAYNVAGLGFAKSEKIAYLTEISLTSSANFAAARTAAINAAINLYGPCSSEVIAVTKAWYAVGVGADYSATCAPVIHFLTNSTSISEGINSTACHPSKTITVPVRIDGPPSQNTTVIFNITGSTATTGADFTISPASIVFVAGTSSTQNINVTIYDDAFIEGDETIKLSYIINANGGNAVAGTTNQTYDIIITDNDATPVMGVPGNNVTLINENFNAAGTQFPAGWVAGSFLNPPGANVWTIGTNGGAGTGNGVYITNNTTTRSYAYNNRSVSNAYLRMPAMNTQNVGNVTLSFNYKVRGETDANGTYDYGQVIYSYDGINFNNANDALLANTSTVTPVSFTLPDSLFAGKPFIYLAFSWVNNNNTGTQPMAIDDVAVTGTIQKSGVETTINSNRNEYIVSTMPVNIYSQQDTQLIAKVANAAADIGCANATVTGAGNGQPNIIVNGSTFKRTEKVIQMTPAVANSTVAYQLTLYFTPAELAIWGADKLKLKFLKVNDGVDLSSNISSSNAVVVTPATVEDHSSEGYIAYTGQFTGFSQFVLVNPTSSLISITAPTVTQPSCTTVTGTIVANATGSGTLEYSVNNGTSWQLSNNFNGLVPGSYNIKVRLQADPANSATYSGNPVIINSGVADNLAPSITLKSNPTVFLTAANTYTVQLSDVLQSVADNCDPNPSATISTLQVSCSNLGGGSSGTPHQAYVSNQSIGNANYDGQFGLTFKVNNANGVVIDKLGAFDDQSNGTGITGNQSGGVRVAIFNQNTQAMVPGLDVTIVGTADPLVGNYRMRSITPVTLPAGNYVIVTKGYVGEKFYNRNQAGSLNPVGDNAAGALSFLNTVYYGSSVSFNFPAGSADGGNPNEYIAGTFSYSLSASNTVTVTATDATGNQNTSTTSVTVIDTFYVLTTKNATINLNASGQATIVPADVLQSLKNNCGVDVTTSTFQVSPSSFTCADIGGGVITSPTPHQAYVSNQTAGNVNYDGQFGLTFKVNDANGIIIDKLGAFDDQSNGTGITGSEGGGVRVAIFNQNTQALVSGLDVTIVGTADPLVGNYRVRTLATPVTLPVGNYVIVTKGYVGEKFYNRNQTGPLNPAGDNAGGALTFLNTVYYGTSASFSFPTGSGDAGNPNEYIAGTFNYKTLVAGGITPHQAYVSDKLVGNANYDGQFGLTFKVNDANGIIIDKLGAFDDQSNGTGISGNQSGGVRVAIFNQNTQAMVPGLDVTIVGTADPLVGNYRVRTLATPVTLAPGNYVIVTKGYVGEKFYNRQQTGPLNPAGDNAAGALTFLHTVYFGTSAAFSFPAGSADGGNPNEYIAGTFNYSLNAGNTKTVTITATDTRGNVTNATATVTLTNTSNSCTPAPVMTYAAKSQQTEVPVILDNMSISINVYPNPSNGQFTVQLLNMKVRKLSLQIMDANGQVVEQKTVTATGKTPSMTIPVDISKHAAGIYLIKFISADGIQTTKVVVSR